MRVLSIQKRSKFIKNEDARDTLEYFLIDNARVIYTKRSKFIKNEDARDTLEYFSIDNARVIYTKKV
jgi:hypothetical protein